MIPFIIIIQGEPEQAPNTQETGRCKLWGDHFSKEGVKF